MEDLKREEITGLQEQQALEEVQEEQEVLEGIYENRLVRNKKINLVYPSIFFHGQIRSTGPAFNAVEPQTLNPGQFLFGTHGLGRNT